jgi:hypothetical protein
MPRTALVTGATAGIGAAFTRLLAREGFDLVAVARDTARLAQLADQHRSHGVRVEVLTADLATAAGREAVAARIASTPIDLLINNAGMSLNTPFLRSTADKEMQLLGVNVQAVMHLTLAALPGMVARRDGAVINVASIAGFRAAMPGSTYPASKAWVISFSESVALSAGRHGVRVMALCPGLVRTEFHERAHIDMSKTPDWLWLDPDQVVLAAMSDLRRGKVVSVPSLRYKMAAAGMRCLPRSLLHRIARGVRGRVGRDYSA